MFAFNSLDIIQISFSDAFQKIMQKYMCQLYQKIDEGFYKYIFRYMALDIERYRKQWIESAQSPSLRGNTNQLSTEVNTGSLGCTETNYPLSRLLRNPTLFGSFYFPKGEFIFCPSFIIQGIILGSCWPDSCSEMDVNSISSLCKFSSQTPTI